MNLSILLHPLAPLSLTNLMRKKVLFTAFLVAINPCYAVAQQYTDAWLSPRLHDHPLTGKIVDLHTQEYIDSTQLLAKLSTEPHILIGEQHDNPDHHLIERFLIRAISAYTPRRVMFEMLSEDASKAASTLARDLSPEAVYQHLRWQNNRWPWEAYRAPIMSAVHHADAVAAGNLNRNTIKQLYAGQASLNRADLVTAKSIPRAAAAKIAKHVTASHCGLIEHKQLQRMKTIQIAKDARMAYVLTEHSTPPSLLVAGLFHTRKDMGVPLHLKLRKTHSTTLALVEVSENNLKPTDYLNTQQADFIWFTPQHSSPNGCAEMKKYYKK